MRRMVQSWTRILLAVLLVLGCSESGLKPGEDNDREQWGILPLRTSNIWGYEAYRLNRNTGEVEGRWTWGDQQYGIVGDTVLTVEGYDYEVFYFSYYGLQEQAYYPYKRLYTNDSDGLWCLGGMAMGDTLLNKTLLYKYPIQRGETFTQIFPRYNKYDEAWCYPDTIIYTCIDDSAWFHTNTDSFFCVVYNYQVEQAEDVSAWLDISEYYCHNIGCVGKIVKSYYPYSGEKYPKYKHILARHRILNNRKNQ